MFKNIIVFDRRDAEKYSRERHINKSAVLSIKTRTDPSHPQIQMNSFNGIEMVRFMEFNDCNTEREGGLTYDEAKQIVDFIETVVSRNDIQTFIVHCDAGESRSAGVAAAVSKYYFNDDSKWFSEKEPNSRVYNLILEELVDRHGWNH